MQEEHVAVADGENEVRHTDYIYMVSDKMLVISMIAELDHHLADEMREVIDDVIDEMKFEVEQRGDWSAIAELLQFVPKEVLNNYLGIK